MDGSDVSPSTNSETGSGRLALPLLVVAAAVLVALGFIGFGGDATGSPDGDAARSVAGETTRSLDGSWELVTINGNPILLDPGTGRKPWVDFQNGSISGSNGENTFGGRYSVEGSTMFTDEVFMTLGKCVGCPKTEATAARVDGFLFKADGFEFRIRSDRLTWLRPGSELEFVALGERRSVYD